ncbi:MAG: Ig-like domain-containing protein [Bacteroidota bacterium]
MLRSFLLAALAALFVVPASAQEVTGLSDWTLYLDPGHSGTNENVGIFGYSEPQKVLRIGLALKEMLETRTDIEAVYISRTNDQQQVGLSQRSDMANQLGTDFFHSIHSNAGSATTNNVLMLYGGWRLNGQTVEKTPQGGARMGDEFEDALSAAMRLPTIGNFADRTFYQGFPDNHNNQFPYLSVNRRTNMASVLSEGGFHTNARQNQLNMNAEWKRLEAQAHYWAILDWHGVPRSIHRIATGIVTDSESDRPINGATVTIDGQTYTTDTYESLFNQYSNDPDQLSNGFFYLEDLGPGTHTVTVSAPNYETASVTITMNDTEFTFADVGLLSTIPPVVDETDPVEGQNPFRVTDPLTLEFSRPMDRTATEAAFALSPDNGSDLVSGSFGWGDNDTRLTFTPDADLAAQTAYTLTLQGTATGRAGDALDGDEDGTGGDPFQLSFTTGFPDTAPPRITGANPRPNQQGVEAQPILTLTYSEPILPASVDGRVTLAANGSLVTGAVQYTRLGEASAISFFPAERLAPTTTYRLNVAPGLEDLFLNEQPNPQGVSFTTGDLAATPREIDDFESDVAGNWWLPQQSGSTTGIVTDSTDSGATTDLASLLYGGTSSLRVDYGWDTVNGPWLVRQYLAGGPPRSVFFDDEATLRVALFGDGSGTLFRFAVDDNGPGGHEVSPWVPVDWIGWRTVDWDLDVDGTGTWIGNGTFDGQLRFDSFQFRYDPDGPSEPFGQVWLDDLELVTFVSTDRESTPETTFALGEGYPNPVRGRATVPLRLPAPTALSAVVYDATGAEVARLASGETWAAGEHLLEWNASGVASGVYFVRVTAEGQTATARLAVIR